MSMENRKIKICLISSHGGHLRELLDATENVIGNKYYVTHKTQHTTDTLSNARRYFVLDPHKSLIKYMINSFQSIYHILKEKPDVVISTGAGIAIATIFICKYLLKSKIIFIESAANVVNPSKTGLLVYKIADLFLIQWRELEPYYPHAKYVNLII
jgi:beta-1,4-N-acetylglucosaminyltransferase